MIQHFPTCRADYPEKPKGEPAQHIETIDLDDGTGDKVQQCVDCGAFEIIVKGDTV